MFLPDVISHTLTMSSQLAEAIYFPSKLKDTEATGPVCPRRTVRCFPVDASQSLTVLSALPEARVFPSGLNQTHLRPSSCPAKVATTFPLTVSNNLNVFSSGLIEASVLPSGL